MKKIFIHLILLALLSSSAFAISLSSSLFRPNPSLFEPNMVIEKDYVIHNFRYTAEPYVIGHLQEYATIKILDETDTTITFRMRMELPEDIGPAGRYDLIVGATEIAPPDGGIVALTRAQQMIMIQVLYDEKVAQFTELHVHNVNEGEQTSFSLTAKSLSKQDISGITGKAFFSNYDNQVIQEATIDTFNLESGKSKAIEFPFDSTGLQAGQYRVDVEMYYEGNTEKLTNTFNVGTRDIKINNYTRNLTSNTINKFNIDVESLWNGVIKRVYADLYVDDELISTTQTYSMSAFEKKTMLGFLDLTGIDGGNHDIKIIVSYDGEQTEVEETIDVFGPSNGISLSSVEIMMIGVILVLIIVVAILFKQRK